MNTNGVSFLCGVLLLLSSGSSSCTVLSDKCMWDKNFAKTYNDLISSRSMCNNRQQQSTCEISEPSVSPNIFIDGPIPPSDCWHFMDSMRNVEDPSTRYSSKCLFHDILCVYLSGIKCYKYHVIPNVAMRDDRGYFSIAYWQYYIAMSLGLGLLWMNMTLGYRIVTYMFSEYNKLLQQSATPNEVRKRITITDMYVTELNSLNNTNFKLKHLYCTTCKEFCNCECTLNPLMVDLLQDTRFLCISDQCNFVGSLIEFNRHLDLCDFGFVLCPFDKQTFEDADALIQHLSTHRNVKKCILDSLILTIPLNLMEKMDFVIIADYKNNFLVIFVSYNTDNTVSFKVGKHLQGNSQTISSYTLFHDYETKGLIQHKGDIVPLIPLLKHTEKYSKLNMKLDLLEEHSEVKMDFFDCANNKMNLIECPICLENDFYEFTQCANGHAFCVSCAARCTTCAICRCQMVGVINVNLKYVWAHRDFPCNNLKIGCLALLKLDERENHKKVCYFREITCPYCYIKFRAVTICAHFITKHYCVSIFDSVCVKFNSYNFLSSRFLVYQQKVFNVKTYFTALHLRCLVELIDVDGIRADRYRYEIVVKDLSNVIIGKTSNVCVGRFDTNLKQYNAAPDFSSSINLGPFKDKLMANNCEGAYACTITCKINAINTWNCV